MIVPFLKNLANPFRSRVVWLLCYSHSRRGKGRRRASFGDCLVFLSLLPRIPYLRSTETQYHFCGGGEGRETKKEERFLVPPFLSTVYSGRARQIILPQLFVCTFHPPTLRGKSLNFRAGVSFCLVVRLAPVFRGAERGEGPFVVAFLTLFFAYQRVKHGRWERKSVPLILGCISPLLLQRVSR